MRSSFAVCLLAGFAALAAIEEEPLTVSDVSGPETWGAADNVKRLKHLYFSEQPDEAALKEAGANGVGVVIDLRYPSERDWDERAAAEAEGLVYYNVPVARGADSFDAGAMQQIEGIVEKHHGDNILLHCSTGNRASGWLATHLVQQHGMNVDDALAVARETGLTRSSFESRVRNYLGTESAASPNEP